MLYHVKKLWPWTRAAGVLERAEAVWEGRAVLQRLEVCLRVRVVVRHVGPRMRLSHAQVGQQERHGLRGHRLAAVGVYREVIAPHALPNARLVDEPLGERGALAMGYHPGDHGAAEHV